MGALPAVFPGPGSGAPMSFFSAAAVAFSPPRRVATEAMAIAGTSVTVRPPIRSIRGSVPPSAVMGFRLCTQTLPVGIDEMGADHLDPGFNSGQRADQPQHLALALGAAFDQRQRDLAPQMRRKGR